MKNKNTGSYIKDVLNSPIDGISIIDESKNIIWMNEKLKRKIGNTKGKLCYEILAKSSKICPNCTAFKTLTAKKSLKSKGVIVNKHGERSKFEFITVPLKDDKIFIEIIRNI